MSKLNSGQAGSTKRRSLFARNSLVALTPLQGTETTKDKDQTNVLKKKRNSFLANSSLYDDDGIEDDTIPTLPGRSYSSSRGGSYTGSLRGSWRSFRSSDDHGEAISVGSPISVGTPNWNEHGDFAGRSRRVLHHGEVQTSSSMFRKKKEYLVLTECHIVRFKSQQKAVELFPE